ncbi:MAG: RluA family pseudouridine synthase [Pseudobdellovibrionaceae bacterium]
MSETRQQVRTLTVREDEDGQRLDRYLKKHIGRTPFALVQKIIRTGQVRVDGKRAKMDTRIYVGQQVRIPPVEDKHGPVTFKKLPGDADLLKSMIVFDDGDLMVMNKPYGLATQGGSKITRHVDGLLELMTDRKGVRPKLVHRLDRDTSGLLIAARKLATVQKMGKIFQGREIRKYYWAVTVGVPEPREGAVVMPLGKGTGSMKDTMVHDAEFGKYAKTEFSVLETAGNSAAFVAFWPRTGRTHQIRAHATYGLETPLLGDEKYNGMTKEFDDLGVATRLHLHAWRIICPNPNGKGFLDLKAPLPQDLKATFKAFGFHADPKADPFVDIDL